MNETGVSKLRKQWCVASAAIVLLASLAPATIAQQPLQQGSYANTIRNTINSLRTAAPKLKAGDPGAKEILAGMATNISELSRITKALSDQANREYDACQTNDYWVNKNVAYLYAEEKKLDAQVKATEARLAEARAAGARTNDVNAWQGLVDARNGLRNEAKAKREDAETLLFSLNTKAAFLSNASVFWGELDALANNRVAAQASIVDNLVARLDKSDSGAVVAAQQKFDSALIEFGKELDKGGKEGLTAEMSNYCAHPPTPPGNRSTAPPCDPGSNFYFTIQNTQTCSPVKVYGPGCPPKPKQSAAPEQVMAAAESRTGNWQRAPDRIWISPLSCKSPSVMYYGKQESADSCELTCKADSECAYWTYNSAMNGFIRDSLNDCWGAKQTILPDQMKAGGYVSGGLNGNGR